MYLLWARASLNRTTFFILPLPLYIVKYFLMLATCHHGLNAGKRPKRLWCPLNYRIRHLVTHGCSTAVSDRSLAPADASLKGLLDSLAGRRGSSILQCMRKQVAVVFIINSSSIRCDDFDPILSGSSRASLIWFIIGAAFQFRNDDIENSVPGVLEWLAHQHKKMPSKTTMSVWE